jgi:hypothetical protein
MAGLARNAPDVVVQMAAQHARRPVRRLPVAPFAADAALHGGGTHRHPRDPVLGGRMAILAAHLQRAHVHVEIGRRVGQQGLQIPVLGVRGPSAFEVTGTAGLPGGPPHLFRDRGEVQRRVGEPAFARILPVRSGGVMTHQAIDIGLVGEVEFRIHPTIANVAGGALWSSDRWRSRSY